MYLTMFLFPMFAAAHGPDHLGPRLCCSLPVSAVEGQAARNLVINLSSCPPGHCHIANVRFYHDGEPVYCFMRVKKTKY